VASVSIQRTEAILATFSSACRGMCPYSWPWCHSDHCRGKNRPGQTRRAALHSSFLCPSSSFCERCYRSYRWP
jgi:hypothetical protein